MTTLDRSWITLQRLVAAGFAVTGIALTLTTGSFFPPIVIAALLFAVLAVLIPRRPRAFGIAVGVVAVLYLVISILDRWGLVGYLSRPQDTAQFVAYAAMTLFATAGTIGLAGILGRLTDRLASGTARALIGLLGVAIAVGLVSPILLEDSASASMDASASASVVAVEDNLFEPEEVVVSAGTTVTWEWKGRAPHNVVGEDFESDLQSEGVFSHRFETPGNYNYVCSMHPGMTGMVTVVEDGSGG